MPGLGCLDSLPALVDHADRHERVRVRAPPGPVFGYRALELGIASAGQARTMR